MRTSARNAGKRSDSKPLTDVFPATRGTPAPPERKRVRVECTGHTNCASASRTFLAILHKHLHVQMSIHIQRVLRRMPHLHRQLLASWQMPCQHQNLRLRQKKHIRHSASALRKQQVVRSTCASSCPLSLSMETHSAWVTTHTS